MPVDATRLLVLGATRQEQPATGYAIMRELSSWGGVEEWASVNPGSIYGALRALVKDGLLTEDDSPAAATRRSYKNSVKFKLTSEGQSAFVDLLRSAVWEVTPYQSAPFMAALCFLTALSRDEAAAAIEERITRLESLLRQFTYTERNTQTDTAKYPAHTVEFVRLAAARAQGELTFTKSLRDRLHDGAYDFADSISTDDR